MKTTGGKILVALALLVVAEAWAAPCLAQAGAAVRGVATELIEAVLKKGGREAAEELAEMGGEKAVRAALENAAREGGEALAERAAQIARKEGLAALRVIDRAPGRWVGVLESLPADAVRPALRAAQREPELVTKIVTLYGKEALEVAAKHPGVGARLVDQFGKDGIELGMKLSTDDAITLARHADDISQLAPGPRAQVLAKLARSPLAVLDFLEKHPKVLLTTAGVATVLAAKDHILGGAGPRVVAPDGTVTEPAPGLIERMADRVLDRFHGPIALSLVILALILLGWGVLQLWHLWKIKRLRQAAEASKTPPR